MPCVQTLRAHTSAAASMDIKEMVCNAKVYLKKVLEGHISVSENQRKLIYVAKPQEVGRFKWTNNKEVATGIKRGIEC